METTKKRKRNDKHASNPSKKIVVEAPVEVPNPKVSIVSSEEGSWEPVVATARGILMPKGLAFKPFTKSRANLPQRPGRTQVEATELLLHSDENVKIDYTAREEEVGEAGSLLKHYIGVYDPETDKLEVVEAREMIVRGVVKRRQAAAESMVTNLDQMNARERRNDLGRTFGTKKAKKAILSLTENAIAIGQRSGSPSNLDAASKVMLETMAGSTAKMSTRDQLQLLADAAKPRPKANLAAEKAADVYPIDTLFDLSLIPVKDWSDDIKAKRDITTKSRFVSSRLNKIRLTDNTPDTQKLKVLRYLLSLVELHNSVISKGRSNKFLPDKTKLKEILDLPTPAVEAARRKFSDSGKVTSHFIDLIVTHICVLALIVDNFEIDSTYSLREDLRLDTKAMKTYFNEVGARVAPPTAAYTKEKGLNKAQASQHHSAKLKLPLEFPKVRVARSKRK